MLFKNISDLEHYLHKWGAFYFYASVCTASALAVLVLVPETRGKSAAELNQEFREGGCCGWRKRGRVAPEEVWDKEAASTAKN